MEPAAPKFTNEYILDKEYPKMPATILVDKEFPPKDQMLILAAFAAWEGATNHKVKFNIILNQPKPGKYKEVIKKDNAPYFVWYFSKWDPNQLDQEEAADKANWKGMNIWHGNTSHIVVFAEDSDKYKLVLHEIGHFLGLAHTETFSIMSKYLDDSSGCITPVDASNVCFIYSCKPKSDCTESLAQSFKDRD